MQGFGLRLARTGPANKEQGSKKPLSDRDEALRRTARGHRLTIRLDIERTGREVAEI